MEKFFGVTPLIVLKHSECKKKVLQIMNKSKKMDSCRELSEFNSVRLIVDLLNEECKYKQDEQTFDMVRNNCWTQVTSYHQKKPKIIGENSTYYIPTMINRFELLSNLTKDIDDYGPKKDTDKESRNYSGCLRRKLVHKETISTGNYKTNTKVAQHACKKHESAINDNYKNQQPHTKDSTHGIPVLINGLTSMDASTNNICYKPKSISQQHKEHKIIIIGDSHARGSASNVKHNVNDNYRSNGFVRPGANIDTLTSSTMEDI
jgi:hypothetical protein